MHILSRRTPTLPGYTVARSLKGEEWREFPSLQLLVLVTPSHSIVMEGVCTIARDGVATDTRYLPPFSNWLRLGKVRLQATQKTFQKHELP